MRNRPRPGSRLRRARTRLVGPLWRWHRRAGVLAALLLIFLAVTGILINHAGALGLDHRPVDWDWPYRLYGPRAAGAWRAFPVNDRWVLQSEGHALFLDRTPIGACDGRLAGAIARPAYLVVGCERELLLVDPGGARIDSLGSATGLDDPVTGLADTPEGIQVLMNGRWRRFDADAMVFGDEPRTAPAPVAGAAAPADLQAALGRAAAWLDWERLLLDLHSGRLFGRLGTLAVDIGGLLSIVLALSGLAIWGLRNRR